MIDTCILTTPYTRQPHKPLFIFFPGMDGTGNLLHRQVESLSTQVDIRCLQLPPNDHSSWSMLTAQVARLIQQEQRSRSLSYTYICGESFGGCLALQFALDYPEYCDQIILVNPASSYNQQLWVRWSASLTPFIPAPLYQLSTWGLLSLLVAPDRVAQLDQRALLSAMQSVTQSSAAWRLSLLQGFNPHPHQLAQLHHPTLIIAGERDRLLPSPAEARRLQRFLPQAQVHYLPSSGHACLLERSVSLLDILQGNQFLQVHQPAQSQARQR